ncbi:response regulator [Anaerolineales bacterium HSG6]|nr:response regulator [Anaerolineales bacterium HSG6]MDM8531999.1 response regulator [Anaerolineales bacterium HSG25]
MSKGRILVVEDDLDISKMLRIYFDSQGYEVFVANRGNDALETVRRKLPDVAILDINLPDIDGYEICRTLRANVRTSQVPVIFLTQKDERSDKIAGLELGADDYITKPFDIEELKLRVEGAIRRSQRAALTHPVTNLPASELIEEQLKDIKEAKAPWILLYLGIRNINAFKEITGPINVNEVLTFLSDVLRSVVEEYGTMNDFVGQASDNDFIIITSPEVAGTICREVKQRFDSQNQIFYPFSVREAGVVTYTDIDGVTHQSDFMKLAIGVVSSNDGPFADIVQITEDAAEDRRRGGDCP